MKVLIILSLLSLCLNVENNIKKMKNYLLSRFSKEGVGAIMGNLYAESGLNPKYYDPRNRSTLRMSEDEYVKLANIGSNQGHKKFVLDKVRFGLAGWARWNRKQALINLCYGHVDDPLCQIEFLIKELREDYKFLYESLTHCRDVLTCCDNFSLQFFGNRGSNINAINDRRHHCQTYYYY